MAARSWSLADRILTFDQRPLYMGILNVTPDSFSDGGSYGSLQALLEQAHKLVAEGAGILDVGGESTRPGAEPVPLEEELRRIVPVIELLAAELTVPISIDTYKAEVARRALEAGARIVNDISGLTFDPEMPETCAKHRAGVICMHIQGTPQTMQQNPQYGNVVPEIAAWLEQRLEELAAQGVPRERVVLDPGIGFGKTAEHNLQILSSIAEFHKLGRPLCIGHSRKGFLGTILGRPLADRMYGTVGVSLALAEQGVEILRLHEISPTRDCLASFQAVREAGLRGE
ncbi:MAG: dihydropteroate synthase [Planctomycetales bacterium]